MTDSTASSTDEKANVVHGGNKATKGGFLSHKKHSPVDENLEEKPAELSADVKPQENEVPPISFFQLFRYVLFDLLHILIDHRVNSYSTKFELFIDFIGLIAAAAAGAAQVSLLCTT